jgi:ribonuclease BN (tRNA processing enzyme)
VLVETRKAYVVFDAGNGLFKLDKYIKTRRPIYLFLSHFHLDHIIGLHGLNKFTFPQGINVFGPKGTKKMFNLVINTPYSKPVNKLKTRVRINEISGSAKFPFGITFRELFHSTLCYGYRLSADGKTLAFCTDTGPCDGINALAKEADLLIAECSLPPGKVDKYWPHLNPQQAAVIARDAKAKKLALVHFDAGAYKNKEDKRVAGLSAREIFKKSIVSKDGIVLVI